MVGEVPRVSSHVHNGLGHAYKLTPRARRSRTIQLVRIATFVLTIFIQHMHIIQQRTTTDHPGRACGVACLRSWRISETDSTRDV